jgi:hypothetical protein
MLIFVSLFVMLYQFADRMSESMIGKYVTASSPTKRIPVFCVRRI